MSSAIFNIYPSSKSRRLITIFILILSPVITNNINAQSTIEEVNNLIQECSNGNNESCLKLTDIAQNDKDYKVRYAAVEGIFDENGLQDIINNKKERIAIRELAVKKIKNQDILSDIARNHPKYQLRRIAVEKIYDINLLREILDKDKELTVITPAVKGIKDQKVLFEIAKNHPRKVVRKIAAEGILNKFELMEIIKTDEEFEVRNAAMRKYYGDPLTGDIVEEIKDQQILGDIAKHYGNASGALNAALKGITDQQVLLDVARNGKNLNVRYIVLNKLDGNRFFNEIVELIEEYKYNIPNLAAVAALRVIPVELISNYGFEEVEIDAKIYRAYQSYNIGRWDVTDFIIDIETDYDDETFKFRGKRGGRVESLQDIMKSHIGEINMETICNFLLEPLDEKELIRLIEQSKIIYLREAAKTILQNKTEEI